MTIYIPQFVLGIIATIVVEVGICFIVGLMIGKKEAQSHKTPNDDESESDETNPIIEGEVGEREV